MPSEPGDEIVGMTDNPTKDECKVACDAHAECTSFAFNDDGSGLGRSCSLKKGKCNLPAALNSGQASWRWVYHLCEPGCSTFQIRIYNNPDRCVKAQGGPDYNTGSKLEITDSCEPNDDNVWVKQWANTAINTGRQFGLKHVKSGRCVHPEGTVGASWGTKVHLWDGCSIEEGASEHVPHFNKKETVDGRQTGVVYANHVKEGDCIQSQSGQPDVGQILHYWACNDEKRIWYKEVCVDPP